MARKRMRRRRDPNSSSDMMNQGHTNQPTIINGKMVHIHQIRNTDEGVLYSHSITERGKPKRRSTIKKSMRRLFSKDLDDHSHSDAYSLNSSIKSGGSFSPTKKQPFSLGKRNFQAWMNSAKSTKGLKQYTIQPKERFQSAILNWMSRMNFPFVNSCAKWWSPEGYNNPDAHNYRPGHLLFMYINWTFTGMWSEVILTFMIIYFVLMLIFTLFLWVAGNAQPACIVAAGAPFGDNDTEDATRFSDAFALSWTTFTTVGYGMIYTAVGGDFQPNGPGGKLETEPHHCSWVVTLCTIEAFLGLLYAGMCAAILFGKVNRVQSHANIVFSNPVCLQYEWVVEDDEEEDDDEDDEEDPFSSGPPQTIMTQKEPSELQIGSGNGEGGEEKNNKERRGEKGSSRPTLNSFVSIDEESPLAQSPQDAESGVGVEGERGNDAFIDQFNGCPVLKFQILNELCNKEGAEIVDAIMKVVGIKFKGSGRVTRSEYVRVNLVDFEHPFLSRVWHGVHVLDGTSPLLTDKAKQRIRENNGSWPSHWFRPDVIKEKLDFADLIVTVAGISNISALTVHAYKRYKIGDVLIGYNFAPLVFRDKKTGMLEVDKTLVNDVREQAGLEGEDLSVRRMNVANTPNTSIHGRQQLEASTIRITKASDHDVRPGPGSLIRAMSFKV
eukprot:CAMPEP_0113407288 /NCGR_PEP_ID=MMETSP0013_2-20120614/19966_1 /TAXON_ID=2843 ORGANISM="Skeletonema costatum, Strain 1716" /NCGR_SAMPLE_ID=MMETSP0013_2 /ASSEMBLY_ACC=CAM_ASM_000158 /LENGTH=664 /DNA_ID=CAMNT_0000293193 /DNA_START=212 /DNA_END=2206 /DNA_ORIENTATION=+ /assembly_acc=CAM_ASM_000158